MSIRFYSNIYPKELILYELVKDMRMLILILIVSVAVVMDVISCRIKNSLIVMGIILGFCFQYREFGNKGILYAMIGMTIPVFLLWIPFCLRAIGAGDVKLLDVSGCFIGSGRVVYCVIYAIFIGGCIALMVMLNRRIFRKRIRYLLHYIHRWIQTGRYEPYYERIGKEDDFIMNFSIAILISVIMCWEGIY